MFKGTAYKPVSFFFYKIIQNAVSVNKSNHIRHGHRVYVTPRQERQQ